MPGGLVKPSRGEIKLDNKPLTGQKVGAIATQIGVNFAKSGTRSCSACQLKKKSASGWIT